MKVTIATEEVLNEHGDIEDGTKSEKQVFVPASKVASKE